MKGLAEKYNGIACEENYHDVLLPDEARSAEETLAQAEQMFGLKRAG